MIARVLAEKDTLRCQLVELQERFFSLQSKARTGERRQSSDVIQNERAHISTHDHNTFIMFIEVFFFFSVLFFLSKEVEVNWESPRSSLGESQTPTRRRLRRMDAVNPMLLSSFNSEVSHSFSLVLVLLDAEYMTNEAKQKIGCPLLLFF